MSDFKKVILMMVSLVFCFSIGECVLATASTISVDSNFIEESTSVNLKTLLKRKSKSRKSSYKPKIKKSKTKKSKLYKSYRSSSKTWKLIKKVLKFALIILAVVIVVGGIWLFIRSRK